MEELKLKHEDDEHPSLMAGVVITSAKNLSEYFEVAHEKTPNKRLISGEY